MNELDFHTALSSLVIIIGGFTFVLLFFISAPYGRHRREGWGPVIPEKLGWVIMESPSVLLFAAVFFAGHHREHIIPLALAALWLTHYVHRTFIYPFRSGPSKKTMPMAVMCMAIVFNMCNAYLNARWISHFGEYTFDEPLWPLFIGSVLFLLGMMINISADNTLLRLKKGSGGRYQIPQGRLFKYVSCPNYAGELLEWFGWAIACSSFAGWSFFIFTFANLVPRARTHHRWYQEKFHDYPAQRRAVFPWLF